MIHIEDKEKCVGCSACANACPVQCIRMLRDEEGFLYPTVDAEKCLNCHLCERVCPCLNVEEKIQVLTDESEAYAVTCADFAMFNNAGSGGAFSLLARYALKQGWYVAGAVWTDDWSVKHIVSKSPETVRLMAGTKYLQSSMGSVYGEIKGLLKNGQKVLFSGTGCQVAGLKRYLKKEYPGLITINIACYGAPSPEVWRRYLSELQNRYSLGKIKEVHFRRKANGTAMNMQVVGSDGRYDCHSYDDCFGWGLIKSVIDRPSCNECLFKGAASCSDITVGDAWGVQDILPDCNPFSGISVVVCHSVMAKDLLSSVRSLCSLFQPLPVEEAVKQNMGIVSCQHPKNLNREKFFNAFVRGFSVRLSIMRLRCGSLRTFYKWLIRDYIRKLRSHCTFRKPN